jgi:hypothetical protein
MLSALNADALMAAVKKELIPALGPTAEPLIDDAIAKASAALAADEKTALDWAVTHKLVITPCAGRIEFTLESK